MWSIRRTLSVPLSFVLCLVFISVADSYSHAALFSDALSRKCGVGNVASTLKIRSYDLSLQRIRKDSFILHSSTRTSEVSEKVSIKKFTKEILQKYLAFCTIFLASILAAPRKALAAAAPLMKNIKVKRNTLLRTVYH
jgi:hypothetical protein